MSRIVRWRAGASRAPPVSSGRRCSSRASSAAGASTLTRAAASSIASGSPSRRRQISATVARWSSSRLKPALDLGRPLDEQSHRGDVGDRPAIADRPLGAVHGQRRHRYSCSPRSRSRARLVASTVRSGAASRSSAINGAAGSRCSRLSRTSSIRCRPATATTDPRRRRCRHRRRAPGRPSLRPAPDRERRQLDPGHPVGESPSIAAATASASRVLPTPPGPVSVSSRAPDPGRRSSAHASTTSASRPTSAVGGTGKVAGLRTARR